MRAKGVGFGRRALFLQPVARGTELFLPQAPLTILLTSLLVRPCYPARRAAGLPAVATTIVAVVRAHGVGAGISGRGRNGNGDAEGKGCKAAGKSSLEDRVHGRFLSPG